MNLSKLQTLFALFGYLKAADGWNTGKVCKDIKDLTDCYDVYMEMVTKDMADSSYTPTAEETACQTMYTTYYTTPSEYFDQPMGTGGPST
jgi:hypothetical protein